MSLVSSFANDQVFDGVTKAFAQHAVGLSSGIAIGAGLFVIGKSALMNSISGLGGGEEGRTVDLQFVGKVIAVLMILSVYTSLISLITDVFTSVNKSFSASKVAYSVFEYNTDEGVNDASNAASLIMKLGTGQSLNNEEKALMDKGNINSMSDLNTLTEFVKADQGLTSEKDASAMGFGLMILDPVVIVTLIFHGLASLLAGIAKVVATAIGFWFLKVFIIIGPFAIALSAFNPDGKNYSRWLGGFINFGLVGLLFNLFDVFFNMFSISEAYVEGPVYGMMETIAFDISMVIMYVSAFRLTSFIFGQNVGGGMFNKAIGLGAAAVAGALLATGAVVGGASGLANKLNNRPNKNKNDSNNSSSSKRNMLGNIQSGIQTISRNLND